MWKNISQLTSQALSEFEHTFHFQISPTLRSFIIDHNGGVPCNGSFPTTKATRRLTQLVDFNDKVSYNGAWSLNNRLKNRIGKNRIIVGYEASGNLICIEKTHEHQEIVVWSHISGDFEPSLLNIAAFMRGIN